VASLLVEVLPDGLEVLPERFGGLDVGVDTVHVEKAAVAVPDDGAEPDEGVPVAAAVLVMLFASPPI
jgi:hypothetical protein